MAVGYIYILSNQAMPSLLKIGFTLRSVLERVNELNSATGVPKPFEIEYYCLTAEVEDVEKEIHSVFATNRIDGKEFFKIELHTAIATTDSKVRKITEDRFINNPSIFINKEDRSVDFDKIDYSFIGTDDIYCKKCGTYFCDLRNQFSKPLNCPKCGNVFNWQ